MSFTLSRAPEPDAPIGAGVESFLLGRRHAGRRVGLVTNHSGITARGVPTWRAFIDAGIHLEALYGPEHGFRGEAQDAVHVADETFHGIKVFSLYGERLRPTEEMLRGIDLMVFDVQDVGCRYYTYLQTLGYTLDACAQRKIPYVVLDRPNPIGGVEVEGGPIAPEHESFVGAFGLPHRYGMTIGEVARYLHNVYYPQSELTVSPVEGWTRGMMETALPWVMPSPNIASVSASLCYPGTCLAEGTNLSEGRGTTRPFEIVGAPWIDGELLREHLSALALPGVVFSSLFFAPTFSKHAGAQCGGVTVHPINRTAFRPLLTGIALIRTIRALYPERLEWRHEWEREDAYFFDRLAGSPAVRESIDRGAPIEESYSLACAGAGPFLKARQESLIYD